MPKECVRSTGVVDEALGRKQSSSLSSCVECRLSKTRCAPSHGAGDSGGRRGSCERCTRYGFECKYVASGRRGPKPRSKANGLQSERIREASMDDGEAPSLVDEAHLERQRATWQRLRRCPAMRGSTYTFVSQGETELTGERTFNKQISAECYPTLRQLLRRADGQVRQSSSDGEWPPSLPATVSLYDHGDPIELGIVSQVQCDTLIAYFEQNMLPWICCFESVRSALQNPASSTSGRAFLLAVVLHLAAHFDAPDCPAPSSHALSKHARALAVHAFATLQTDENTLLAFDLLSVWKAPDDNFSEVYAVYADHVAATLTRSRRTDAVCIRAQLFHYIQRSVFHLHVHADNAYEAGRQGNTPTDLVDLLSRATVQETLPTDWFICADVESIVIQRRCKELLHSSEAKGEQSGGVLSGAHTAVLAMLSADLDVWERRWRRRARAAISGLALSSQALQILGNSVNMHISSMVFRQASQVVLSSSKGKTAVSWCDLLAQSYQTCLAGATGILRTIQDISSPALAHAPDAIVILINHAALLSVYLSAFPVAIHDLSHRHAPRIQTLLSCSPDEVLTLVQGARDALHCAAGCLARESICTLSADHLDGLLAVCNGSDSPFDAGPDVMQDFVRPGDNLYGLDWLSSVLFDLDPTLLNEATQV